MAKESSRLPSHSRFDMETHNSKEISPGKSIIEDENFENDRPFNRKAERQQTIADVVVAAGGGKGLNLPTQTSLDENAFK